MKPLLKGLMVFLVLFFFSTIFWLLVQDKNVALLMPHGDIALQERNLIIFATILMLAVVVPVFVLTALISWRYRAGNTKAKYLPNWEHSFTEELVWWGIPCAIVFTLAIFSWKTSVELDPFRPLPGEKTVVQAVSLNWKWLFIYPEERVASVNYLAFPVAKPVEFHITSEGPMNSLWIPQLGGQIYAMTGMETKLSLIASKAGRYYGMSSNLSGEGFSGMHFDAVALPQEEYERWIATLSQGTSTLNQNSYEELRKPSSNDPVRYYSSVAEDFFESIIARYHHAASSNEHH